MPWHIKIHPISKFGTTLFQALVFSCSEIIGGTIHGLFHGDLLLDNYIIEKCLKILIIN